MYNIIYRIIICGPCYYVDANLDYMLVKIDVSVTVARATTVIICV